MSVDLDSTVTSMVLMSTPLSPDMDPDAKREWRRAKVTREILDTERTYQNHLELVATVFENPLREQNLIPDHVIVTIFSNVRQIININQELYEYLTTLGVGAAFLKIAPFLKLYSTYANNHERALATLIEWEQKVPEFSEWRRRQEELPEMCGLKLNALLITPVQRIPRYKLLLEELLQNTNENSDDYNAIREAYHQVESVAQHINQHIKQQDNFMKMLAIQKSLAGPAAPKILIPGRIFIKEGVLKKVSRKGGRSHERKFFLFSDMLMYAKPKLLENGLHSAYACCCMLPLQHCRVSRVLGCGQGEGTLFTITCKSESLLLYSDQKSVETWIAVLTKAIGEYVQCRQTLKKPSSAKQPLRRPALMKLRKEEKAKDPLEQAKKTPERRSSPRVMVKRVLQDTHINCLTPCKNRRNSSCAYASSKPGDSTELDERTRTPRKNLTAELMADANKDENKGSAVKKRKRGIIERLTPLKKSKKVKPESTTSPAKKLKISPTKKPMLREEIEISPPIMSPPKDYSELIRLPPTARSHANTLSTIEEVESACSTSMYVDVHEEDDEDEGPVWVSRTDTEKSEANESNSDDSCLIDTALDQSYGYDGPVYVWNPGEQFPGQGDLVWKSEDEFSDYDYTDDDEEPSRDSARDQRASHDMPRRVPPMFDENAARDMLQQLEDAESADQRERSSARQTLPPPFDPAPHKPLIVDTPSKSSRGMELIRSTAGVISPRLQRLQETVVKVAAATGEYLTNRDANVYNNACVLQ